MKHVFKSGTGAPGEGRREAKTVEALEVLNELQNVKRANERQRRRVLRTKPRLLCEAARTAGKVEGEEGRRERTRERGAAEEK